MKALLTRGMLAGVIVMAASIAGFEISPEEASVIEANMLQIVTGVGAVIAAWPKKGD